MTELEDKLAYLAEIKISRPGTKQEYLALVAQLEQEIQQIRASIVVEPVIPSPTLEERTAALEDAVAALLEG